MSKLKWFIIFLIAFGCLGYFREFFFVHMNNIMYRQYYGRETDLPVPSIMMVFTRFSYNVLYYSKYIFTILWAGLFFLMNYFTVKKLANIPVFTKLLIGAYGIMFVLAGLSMAYGYLINDRLQDSEYTLSRWLLGIAQSPIICLILLASEKLYRKSFQS